MYFFKIILMLMLFISSSFFGQETQNLNSVPENKEETFVQKIDFLYGNWDIISIKQKATQQEIFSQGWEKFNILLSYDGAFGFDFLSKEIPDTDFEIDQESLGYKIKLLNHILALHTDGKWNFNSENKQITLMRNFNVQEEPVTEILSSTMFKTFNLTFLTPKELVFTIEEYDSKENSIVLSAIETSEKGEEIIYLIHMKKNDRN